METQSLQSNKNSKITVPFYSPPSRLYGQTSAEIIKEARAAVMNTPVIGIKPVFTSRPFTPKEKERVLFGNVKKKTARPPSAFSLSYLQKQEAVPRIKLPSIGIAPKKKQYRGSNFRTTFSLDNLTEEYEAEILEEKMRESNIENLPTFRKSYSCPQERHLTRAVSCTERLSFSELDDYRGWAGSGDYGENVSFLQTSDSYSTFSSDRNSDDSYDLPRYAVSAGRGRYDELNRWSSDELPKNHIHNISGKQNERHGAGDFDIPTATEKAVLIKKTYHLPEPLHTIDDQNNEDAARTIKKENRKSKKKKQVQEMTLKNENNEINENSHEKFEIMPDDHETDGSKEVKTPDIEMSFEDNQSTTDDVVSQVSKETEDSKMETVSEKSVETDIKSDYLIMIESQGVKAAPEEITPSSKPREILELYETARYYGVVLDESKNIVSSTTATKEENLKAVEDVFGEKESEPKQKPINPNDYLENLRANFKHIDEKMKKLNGSIENFEKKLSAKGNHSTRAIKDNAINEAKATGNRKILSDKEFVMNSNKRYHVSNRNSENGEKAYKKWANKETSNNPTDKQYSREGGWDFFWKNTYFRTKEDMENNSGDKSKKDSALEFLQDLVDRLNGFIKVGCEDQEIIDTTNQLYKAMKSGGYFSNNTLENKFKAKILRILYQFADSENGAVLLCLARIIFALRVESSLSAACKMVFKVARSDTNDHLFIEMEDILELFLEGIGRASPLEAAESVIYGYGALKFLTMNHSILSRALHLGAMDLMTLHMKMINTATVENSNVGEQTQHALFQLTGALRHIAAGDGALPLFVTTNCIPIMCKTLLLFRRDEDLVTNISRTLSLLSTDEDITQVLMNVDNILNIVIDLIDQYKNNDKILIRLSYCLGNIVAHSDLARIQLSRNENSLRILLGVLKLYIDKDLELSMKEKSEEVNDELDPETVDDVIVKIIRIVANMSMNPVVGSNLSPATNEKHSLQLSQLLSVLLLRKDPGITLLATLGCLNNISYYCNTHSTLVDITQGVERVLGLSSEECQAEAARVLGNLTRHKEIRDLLFNTGGIEKLSKLLLSQDREVVRCACGALVNMMLDVETRKQFVENQGIDKLIQAFEFFSEDWSLAGLVCRAIWNSCAEDVSSAMMHNNMEHLLNTLANALEEENWNDGDAVWEEFATIATDLLERINAHLESV